MKHLKIKLLTIVLAVLMMTSMMPSGLSDLAPETFDQVLTDEPTDSLINQVNADFNLTNEYQKIWEPNNIRGSTHAIAVSDDNEWMATAGGYLNDREVHIYRWYDALHQYFPIFDAGDTIIQGDVLDVAFMDCDNNNKLEVVAACADGHIYVFEQMGDRDEAFNLFADAHQWELVWDSGLYIDRQVWSVVAYDIDHDSHDEIIAGAWDGKVYVFDYIDHSAWPYCLQEHWIEFEPVWDSGDTITDRVNSVAIVDSDNDTRMEIVAGSQDNHVYLFEERPCLKHTYELRWTSGDALWAPVTSVTASQELDDDNYGEIVASAYGQGVIVFEYNYETDDFDVRKLNQGIKSWERAISETAGVYTGYEADEWIDRKVWGWNDQGIFENDPIPSPWDTEELGGASALGGPWDNQETTFDSSETFELVQEYTFELGDELHQSKAPYDIATGPDGSIYVTDISLMRIVRYTDTLEPILSWGMEGDEPGNFSYPSGLAVDEEGFVYVADFYNNRIQKFTAEGDFVDIIATNGSANGQVFGPFDIAISPEGNLYVSEYFNQRIQVLDRNTGEYINKWGAFGSSNGEFDQPSGLAFDSYGYLLVADYKNDRVQQFAPDGTFNTTFGSSGSGPGDMNGPVMIGLDHDGRVYVSDYYNDRVQKFSPTFDYESEFGTSGSGPGQMHYPIGVSMVFDGMLVTDTYSNRIQKFAVHEYEMLDALGMHVTSSMFAPIDVAFDSEGNYYLTGVFGNEVQKYASDGTFLLNWSVPTSWLFSVEVDEYDNVFVCDVTTDKVLLYTTEGTLRDTFGGSGSGDGQLDSPADVATNMNSNRIFVSEYQNNRISVFDRDDFGFLYHIGGPGSSSGQFNGIYGIEIGPDGLLYAADRYNHRIQRFFQNGTFVDSWSTPDEVMFMAFDRQGNLYGTGGSARTLKKYSPEGNLVDNYDGEFASYTKRIGTIASWGIDYRPENHTLYIADQDSSSIIVTRPYTAFNNKAEAVVDFGQWEELGGDATDEYDMILISEDDVDLENLELMISQDLETWVPLELTEEYVTQLYWNTPISGWADFVYLDVDHALRAARWDEFRYMKIAVKGGVVYDIDAAFGTVARPIDTALVVSTGYIRTGSSTDDELKIIIGTVDGEIMAYGADGTMYWESQSDQPRFSLGTSIWDIVQVNGKGLTPTWEEDGPIIWDTLVSSTIPGFSRFLSFDLVDIDGTDALDMIVTVRDGVNSRLLYYRNTGTDAAPSFSHITDFFKDYTSMVADSIPGDAMVTVADMDGDYDEDMIICNAYWEVDTGYNVEVRYFERTGSLYWTERSNYLPDIQSLANGIDFVPRIFAIDLDGDFDNDLVVSLDKLYYFEQTGYSSGFQFYLDRDDTYFQEINDDRKNETVFGRVMFWDFDLDGDLDIVVPHASENYSIGSGSYSGYKCETGRFTYWRNTNNRAFPEWTKTRAMFEPDFTGTLSDPDHGYDYPILRDMDGDGLLDLICLQEDSIDLFWATLDHDSFLCATYPFVHMVEVDKRTQAAGYWGYEAMSTWTDWFKFETWSRSLEFGDVDQDGLPEVFVGSFDYNIIGFENVANDTYRRSWRSNDFFLQSYDTGENFPAYVNIHDMVIGDQDHDGKQELIVTAGWFVYVFEAVGDDQYELVWSSPTRYYEDYGGTKIGEWLAVQPYELAVDEDLDNDGLPEIIVGCGDTLVIFENQGDNNYTQVAYQKYTTMEAGTPFIRGIDTGDVNKDGTQDIVLVGTDDVTSNGYITDQYGWIKLVGPVVDEGGNYEDNKYFTYGSLNTQSPAWSVDIDDNDLDNRLEIFIGTGEGVQIWEQNDAGSILKIQVLPTADTVKAVKAGNTDGDSWLEVVAGTGNNLTVFEQNQTKARTDHIYDNVWNSGELAEEITDLQLGDSNLNTRMEIIATARKGHLYSYEWVVNSSSIAVSPAFSLAEIPSPVMDIVNESPLVFLDNIHSSRYALLQYLEREARRFSVC